jgi:GntR family transcriptional repressor for pyruvate dehydrogenase complex
VRQQLEVPSVRLAAAHRSDEALSRLKEIVRTQKAASVDDPSIPDLDRQFHSVIGRASGNRVLASLIAGLHRATEPVHYLDLSPEVGRETVRQHQKIVRAIEARDADAAEHAIVEHLSYLRQHITDHRSR